MYSVCVKGSSDSDFYLFTSVNDYVYSIWSYFWFALAFNSSTYKRNSSSNFWNKVFKFTFWNCVLKSSGGGIYRGLLRWLFLWSIWFLRLRFLHSHRVVNFCYNCSLSNKWAANSEIGSNNLRLYFESKLESKVNQNKNIALFFVYMMWINHYSIS